MSSEFVFLTALNQETIKPKTRVLYKPHTLADQESIPNKCGEKEGEILPAKFSSHVVLFVPVSVLVD